MLTTFVPSPSPAAAAAAAAATPRVNAMTVSWLTCVDNQGHVVMSLNCGRSTVENLRACPRLSLSAAVHGMEDMLYAIGTCSGRDFGGSASDVPKHETGMRSGEPCDKATHLALPLCHMDWTPWPCASVFDADTCAVRGMPAPDAVGADGSVAQPHARKRARRGSSRAVSAPAYPPALATSPIHMAAEVVAQLGAHAWGTSRVEEPPTHHVVVHDRLPAHADSAVCGRDARGVHDDAMAVGGHHLFLLRVREAWVQSCYWASSKSLSALPPSSDHTTAESPPPLLSFLGGGSFGLMPLPVRTSEAGAGRPTCHARAPRLAALAANDAGNIRGDSAVAALSSVVGTEAQDACRSHA
ncbi:hypothetical protein EON62_04875 [archaeon]|nr:MAG: hypothetical protein EON62_04875 [archaeon]